MRLSAFLFSFLLFSGIGFSGIQEIVHETQVVELENNEMIMLWWIPTEYWAESLKSTPGMTKEQIEEFSNTVKPYTILAVVDAKIGVFGGSTPKTKEELTKKLSMKIGKETLKPLPQEKLSQNLQNFVLMMKPMMSQMLGQFGSGMEFIVFPGQDDSGKQLIDVKKEGMLTFNYLKPYNFRLPLGSLMPPMWDPKTAEEFPGNYKFNPFTGSALKKK